MQTAVTRCFTNLRLIFSSKETPLRVLRPRQADVKSALISPRPQARPRLSLRGRCHGFAVTERDVVRPHPRCSSVGGDAHIAPPFSHHIPGGQSRPPYAPSTERPPCFFPVIPRARSARGNPFPFHVNQRPLAATYLCRFAAKARFDNRLTQGVRFPKGRGRPPSPLVVSRGKDF